MLLRNIEDLKAGPLSLEDAQRKCFEIFYRRLLPSRMLIPVTDSYLSKEDRTGWALLNACILHAHGHTTVWGTTLVVGRSADAKRWSQQLKAWWAAHKAARRNAHLATLTAPWDATR